MQTQNNPLVRNRTQENILEIEIVTKEALQDLGEKDKKKLILFFFDRIDRESPEYPQYAKTFKYKVAFRIKNTQKWTFDGQDGGNVTVLKKLLIDFWQTNANDFKTL